MAGTADALSPQAWADAALEVVGEEGVEALSVEALARRLGVTKGSFYWHFSSRAALLLVALARWEKLDSERLRSDLDAIEEPRARLRRLLWRGGDPLLERWLGSTEANVRRALDRVRERRLKMLAELYTQLGVRGPEARRRAVLAYAAYLGLTHLDPAEAAGATELLLPPV